MTFGQAGSLDAKLRGGQKQGAVARLRLSKKLICSRELK
jgi:hypothetical protein